MFLCGPWRIEIVRPYIYEMKQKTKNINIKKKFKKVNYICNICCNFESYFPIKLIFIYVQTTKPLEERSPK